MIRVLLVVGAAVALDTCGQSDFISSEHTTLGDPPRPACSKLECGSNGPAVDGTVDGQPSVVATW